MRQAWNCQSYSINFNFKTCLLFELSISSSSKWGALRRQDTFKSKVNISPQWYFAVLLLSEISPVIDTMEQVNFDQSLRNIPFGSRKEYTKQMTHSIRRTLFNMRWAAAFYLGIIKSKDEEGVADECASMKLTVLLNKF